MENPTVSDLALFVEGYGDGSGDGSGNGEGYGTEHGCGSVSGDGEGYGNGSGSGAGLGSGAGFTGNGGGDGSGRGEGYGFNEGRGHGDGFYGVGIKSINGRDVHFIDDAATIIEHVHGDFAQGYILKNNVYLVPCYIVKSDGYFAHGETLKAAREALHEKIEQDRPVEDRIAEFVAEFPIANVKVDAARLYDWHHRLTGSCEMGRRTFCVDHDIDYHRGRYTVLEFIGICKGEYGGKIIKQLEEQYESK